MTVERFPSLDSALAHQRSLPFYIDSTIHLVPSPGPEQAEQYLVTDTPWLLPPVALCLIGVSLTTLSSCLGPLLLRPRL